MECPGPGPTYQHVGTGPGIPVLAAAETLGPVLLTSGQVPAPESLGPRLSLQRVDTSSRTITNPQPAVPGPIPPTSRPAPALRPAGPGPHHQWANISFRTAWTKPAVSGTGPSHSSGT